MRARTRRAPEDPGSAVRREPEAHPLLALQHAIGNRATAAALARDPVRDAAGTITAHRFDVGTHISAAVAAEAKRVAAAGAITTAQLTSIRTNTLAADSTIDDNERLFMAGLLDAANARTMATASVSPGDRIEFPAASITLARRAAAEAAGRAAMPPDVARLLDQVAAAALALDFTTAVGAARGRRPRRGRRDRAADGDLRAGRRRRRDRRHRRPGSERRHCCRACSTPPPTAPRATWPWPRS